MVKPLPNTLFQLGRVALGAALVARPQITRGVWKEEGQVLARGLGVRDIAIGAASIKAADSPQYYRVMLALGVLVDSVDCAASYKSGASRVSYIIAGIAVINGLLLLKESRQADPMLLP